MALPAYLDKIPSQYLRDTGAGYEITDPAYAAAYGEIRKYFSSGLAGGDITYSAFHQMNPYVDLSPLAQSLFVDQALIDRTNAFNENAVASQNEAYQLGAEMQSSWLAHSGLSGTGSGAIGGPIGTAIEKTFGPIFEAQYQVSTDPAHATAKDFILAVPLPVYAAAAPAIIGAASSGASLLASAAQAIPTGLATLGTAVATLLNKGKDTVTNLIDQAKAALSGGKPLDLGGLSNIKIPDLGNLGNLKLPDLAKISVPSQLKDALSGIIPAKAAPLQYQSAPDSIPVDIPSGGPSPVLLAGGALAVIGVIWLMKRR